MTATDNLRRMLDERGVKWWKASPCKTKWHSPVLGGPVAVREWDGKMVLDAGYVNVTPEQAIAATLGAGTCHVKAAKKMGDSFGFSLSCGHSMVNPFNDHPDYCPWCGRKVVDK